MWCRKNLSRGEFAQWKFTIVLVKCVSCDWSASGLWQTPVSSGAIVQLPSADHLPHLSTVDNRTHTVWSCQKWTTRYFNAVLHGAPTSSISKLQRIQNSVARIVPQAPRRSDAKSLFHQLHWLSLEHWISYKLAVLTFKVCITSKSSCLSRHVKIHHKMSDYTHQAIRYHSHLERFVTLCYWRSFSHCL